MPTGALYSLYIRAINPFQVCIHGMMEHPIRILLVKQCNRPHPFRPPRLPKIDMLIALNDRLSYETTPSRYIPIAGSRPIHDSCISVHGHLSSSWTRLHIYLLQIVPHQYR